MAQIYIIKATDDKIYVGSTCRPLRKRQAEHQSECFNPKRRSYYSPVYQHFRKCGMTKNDLTCIPIMDTEQQLQFIEEAKWINTIGSLNSKCSIEDLAKTKARQEKWRQANKHTRYCPCGGTWSYTHKQRHYRTKLHQAWLDEEHQKKIKYLYNIQDAAQEEKTQIKHIVLSYDHQNKKFLKEGEQK